MMSRCFTWFPNILVIWEPKLYQNLGYFTRNGKVSAEDTKYAETFTKSIRKYNPPSYFCGQNQSNISNNAQNSFNNSIFESQVYNHPSSKGRIILLPVSNTTPINNAIKTITIPTIQCFPTIIILYWSIH